MIPITGRPEVPTFASHPGRIVLSDTQESKREIPTRRRPGARPRWIGGSALVIAAALAIAGCASPADPGPRAPSPVDPADPGAWAAHALDPCGLLDAPGVRAVLQPTGPSHLVRPHACMVEYRGPGGRADHVLLELGGFRLDPGLDVPVSLAGLAGYQHRIDDTGTYEWGLGRVRYSPDGPTCHVRLLLSERRTIRVRAADAGGDDDAACAVAREVAREVALQLADPAALARRAPADLLTRWDACQLVAALPDATGRSGSEPGGDKCSADLPDGGLLEVLSPPRRIYVGAEFGPEPGTPPLDASVLFWSIHGPVEVVELPPGPAEQVYGEMDSVGPACAVAFAAHRVPDAPPSYAVGRMTVAVFGTRDACSVAHAAVADLRTLLTGPPPALPPTPARLGVPFR
jgi:hypothetical protein